MGIKRKKRSFLLQSDRVDKREALMPFSTAAAAAAAVAHVAAVDPNEALVAADPDTAVAAVA